MKKLFQSLSEKINIKNLIEPKDEEDYYTIGRYLISRGLVTLLIFLIGAIAFYYLFIISLSTVFGDFEAGVRIYSYDSVALRFISDTVKIKAESGYIAYYGEVEKGMAEGRGILYTKTGEIRYEGEFKENEYSGEGTLYNKDSTYKGEFQNNLYEGEGILYRLNGSKEYEGEFHQGKRAGNGELYDSGNQLIFTGNFLNDELMYQDFLGKTADELAKMYTGKRRIYYNDTSFAVDMTDISVVYAGTINDNSLDDTIVAERIFICSEECILDGKRVRTIEEVRRLTGGFSFEGNSQLTMQEAVALKEGIEAEQVFSDVLEVSGYAEDKLIYLYMAEYNDIQYTFYSYDRDGKFIMYAMEQ